jgi:hypothetical protein
MNNIEMSDLKRGLRKYFGFDDEKINQLHTMNEVKLSKIKTHVNKIRNDEEAARKENIRRKIDKIFNKNPELKKKRLIGNGVGLTVPPKGTNIGVSRQKPWSPIPVEVNSNRKPKILFMTDVKGWAWWIKSEYIKKYLSDEFDIDIKPLLADNGAMLFHKINQSAYDLYFSYGFSYIDFLTKVPKKKKICGVTAHRQNKLFFLR